MQSSIQVIIRWIAENWKNDPSILEHPLNLYMRLRDDSSIQSSVSVSIPIAVSALQNLTVNADMRDNVEHLWGQVGIALQSGWKRYRTDALTGSQWYRLMHAIRTNWELFKNCKSTQEQCELLLNLAHLHECPREALMEALKACRAINPMLKKNGYGNIGSQDYDGSQESGAKGPQQGSGR